MIAIFDNISTGVITKKFKPSILLEFERVNIQTPKTLLNTLDLSSLAKLGIKFNKIKINHPNEVIPIEIVTSSTNVVINQRFGDNVDELTIRLDYNYYGRDFNITLNTTKTYEE